MKFLKELMLSSNLILDETGATAIEYGLIAALLAVGLISAMQGLGGALQSTFNNTSSAMATPAA